LLDLSGIDKWPFAPCERTCVRTLLSPPRLP